MKLYSFRSLGRLSRRLLAFVFPILIVTGIVYATTMSNFTGGTPAGGTTVTADWYGLVNSTLSGVTRSANNITFPGKITVGTAPTAANDVATKDYVDTNTAKLAPISVSGNNVTVSGKITVGTASTAANDVATKTYVDTLVSGGSVSGITSINGNIGIGTTNPGGKLEVYISGGSSHGTSNTNIVISNTNDPSIIFKHRDRNFTEALFIPSTQGLSMSTNNGTYYLVANAGNVSSFSDIRLKENIQPLTHSLETIKKLQGVSFDWKNPNDLKRKFIKIQQDSSIGFIAQDIEKILPVLVNENHEGLKSVQYELITAILVEAMKEQ